MEKEKGASLLEGGNLKITTSRRLAEEAQKKKKKEKGKASSTLPDALGRGKGGIQRWAVLLLN